MIKTVGSICSGIEAASVAWKPMGVSFKWFSEIAPFPSQVLKEKFPKVPNLNAKQVATYLNVSVQCLEFWRKKSLGPAYRQNPELQRSRVTYSKRDVAEYHALSRVQTL